MSENLEQEVVNEEPLVGATSGNPISILRGNKSVLGKATVMYYMEAESPTTVPDNSNIGEFSEVGYIGEVIEMGELVKKHNDDRIEVTYFSGSQEDAVDWRRRHFIDGLDSEEEDTFEITLNYNKASYKHFYEKVKPEKNIRPYAYRIRIADPEGTGGAALTGGGYFNIIAEIKEVYFNAAIDSQITFRVVMELHEVTYSDGALLAISFEDTPSP